MNRRHTVADLKLDAALGKALRPYISLVTAGNEPDSYGWWIEVSVQDEWSVVSGQDPQVEARLCEIQKTRPYPRSLDEAIGRVITWLPVRAL